MEAGGADAFSVIAGGEASRSSGAGGFVRVSGTTWAKSAHNDRSGRQATMFLGPMEQATDCPRCDAACGEAELRVRVGGRLARLTWPVRDVLWREDELPFLLRWERRHRMGRCVGRTDSAEVRRNVADHIWQLRR